MFNYWRNGTEREIAGGRDGEVSFFPFEFPSFREGKISVRELQWLFSSLLLLLLYYFGFPHPPVPRVL
jgi:hypothetical protein